MIFILGILFAVLIGIWANHRGRNPIVWGIVSLLLSPLLAAIALALMKDLSEQRKIEENRINTSLLRDRVSVSEANLHSRMDHVEQRLDRLENNGPAAIGREQRPQLPKGHEKYCSACGTPVEGDALYCPHCGARLY
ncbi:zinc ribbon domain-containing protein [Megasphaera hominis]|uniref:Zinc ribbon domain-containing protein n=1 Tax=Megasphaera hominis TaxID=159836 RepID=A0ABR6VFV2_9FIRM|nr:zinc ribbon domain-containing protein [Megasphaera hominis]MBC3536177.1 zinc ribbon domain-containing protein [Megasphaera hominis]